MLRFTVYDERGPATSWPLVNAHMVGPEDVPTPGRVKFEHGILHCKKSVNHAVGLCLLYDAGAVGRLMLQTCLLPDRKEPYVLAVELARHRIKMFIAKSEEWQMFDLSSEHPAMQLWETARQLFTEALICEDPLKADEFGRQSLTSAIEATERLALAHAEILLHRRYGSKPASSTTLGVRVWPGRDSQRLRDLLGSEFDVVSLPLRWREIEVEEGRYNWDPLDRWMQWAAKQGKPIIAGPLLDFSPRSIPRWMYVWQNDYDTCRDLAYDHIHRVVERYKSVVGIWNLGCGLNVNQHFEFTSAQMLDLTRMANLLVRQLRKNARTMIELAQPFGEQLAGKRESLSTSVYLDRIVQEGIRLDCIGLQLLFGQGTAGRTTRDLMQISSLIDRLFLLELPVLISALGVPSDPIDENGGYWQQPWNAAGQSTWAGRLFAIALSKPFVESLIWTDLFDHDESDLPRGGLIDDQGQPKPVMQRLTSLRRQMRKPLGPLQLPRKPDRQPAAS